jgi:hypothetical protein
VLAGDTVRAAADLALPLVVSLGSQRVCDRSESRVPFRRQLIPIKCDLLLAGPVPRTQVLKCAKQCFAEVTPAVSGARGFRHRRKVWDEVMYPVGSAQSGPVVTWMGKAGAGTALVGW